MVFSSVPIYLDPPNWNQQPSHQPATDGVGGGGEAHQLPSAAAAVAPRADGNVPGAARPMSMAERARLAKVPQPEPALNCPRCDSTNTKFCYFNNYSLSQPRHFCKTCRRYWTRGGALRNVPVGGGCRRNKRGKSGSGSKSSSATADRQSGGSSSTATSARGGAIPLNIPPQPQPQLPFMASLQPLADYGATANIGLSFPGMQAIDTGEFQLGGGSSMVSEQWRLPRAQQFRLWAGLEPPPLPAPPSMGLFPFDGEGMVDGGDRGFPGQVHGKPTASGLITQLAAVKMEENPQGHTLPTQYLGIPGSSDQYWSGTGAAAGWTDLSGFSSSTSNIL